MVTRMQIVVWNQVDTDKDGTCHESWQANVVHKAISASGPTAANAVFQLVSWLRKSVDGTDNSVADIDLVIREAPEFPPHAKFSEKTAILLRKKLFTEEEQAILLAEANAAWRAMGLGPVTARSRKAFEDAPPIVAERFAGAKPFVDTAIDIPEGWDVRVWEG